MKARNYGAPALIFAILLLPGCGDSLPPTEQACVKQIERSLKFPEDAEWHDLKLTNRRGDYVTVSGTVVAPNAFGARSRMEFDCRLQEIGSTAVVNYATLDGQSAAQLDRIRRSRIR